MKTLPQYYIIKRDEANPLWKKYIDWLNDGFYNGTSHLYYGFNGKYFCSDWFEKHVELITLEYWNECVNNEFYIPAITDKELKEMITGKNMGKNKTFTVAKVRDLLSCLHREEISFSRMVELMNEIVEKEKIDFGNYLLSQERNGNIVNDELKNVVGHWDLLNFKNKLY